MARKRRTIKRVALLLLILLSAWVLLYLNKSVYPLVQQLSKAKVENRGQTIINESIEKQLESGSIDYDNLILLEKDVSGTITALKTNMAEINRLKTQVLSIVDESFLELDIDEIGLPLGSIFFPMFFSGTGPKLPVKVMSVSNSDASYRNVFQEAGINQTSHRIMMDVIVDMTILTPVGTEYVRVLSSVMVAETVIVGNVPQSYVNVGE